MSWKQVREDLANTYRHSLQTFEDVQAIKRWRQRHPKLTVFVARRIALKNFAGLPLTLIAAALVYTVVLFFEIAADYLKQTPLVALDVRIANLLFSLRSDEWLRFSYFVTMFAEAGVVIALAAFLTVILWIRRQRVYALTLWLALIAAEGTTAVTKILFQRARPDALIRAVSEDSFSFPSGHATTAVAFYGLVAYLFIRSRQSWKARIFAVLATGFIALAVDFSRLYLAVHYLSDVLAGNLVGVAALILAIGATEWLIANERAQQPAQFSNAELLMVAGSAIAIVLAVVLIFAPLSLTHRLPTPPVDIGAHGPISLFVSGALPRYTETLIGRRQEPTNIVMVGDERCLVKDMAAAGWALAEGVSLSSTERIAEAALLNREYPTAPMTPSFYDKYPNDYGFEKQTEEKTIRTRHHVRFWKTGYASSAGEIIAGTASLDTGIKWGVTHRIAPDIDTERDLLVADLENAGVVTGEQRIPFVPPTLGKNFAGEEFFTNGEAVIITLKACQ